MGFNSEHQIGKNSKGPHLQAFQISAQCKKPLGGE